MLLAGPLFASADTIGRMSFWVAPGGSDAFTQLHRDLVTPLLSDRGFLPADVPARATPDSVVSYLYSFTSPTALDSTRHALWQTTAWQATLRRLADEVGLASTGSIRCELTRYTGPAGPGESSPAGTGLRVGPWVRFDVQDNLPANGAGGLLFDAEGVLWFSALFAQGLVRYDGETFTRYSVADGLLGDRIRVIYLDRDERLWIGTENGLCLLDDGRLTSFTVADGLPAGDILAIEQTRNGDLWFGGTGGLSRYDGERFDRSQGALVDKLISNLITDRGGALWIATLDPVSPWTEDSPIYRMAEDDGILVDMSQTVGREGIYSLFEDRDGNLWFGQSTRVTRYDGHSTISLTRQDGLASGNVVTIAEDDDGNLWFGSGHDGLSRWDGQSVSHFTTEDGLPNDQIMHGGIAVGEGGALWIGTMAGGLVRYDGIRLAHFTESQGLPTNYVFAGVQDRDNQLWFATPAGLARLDGNHFVSFDTRDGLAENRVWDLGLDAAGDLWMLHDGVLAMTHFDGQTFETIPIRVENAQPGVYGKDVMAIGHQGQVWQSRGADLYRHETDGFHQQILEGFLADTRITALYVDQKGQLWLGTGQGLWRWDGRSATRIESVLPRSVDVTFIGEDRRGRLWAGNTVGQVVRLDGERNETYSPSTGTRIGMIRDIIEDRRGHLWIGIYGGGVVRFDGLVFQYLSTRDGLINDAVQGFVEDHQGNIWICTDGGITRYRPSDQPPSLELGVITADERYDPVDELSISSSQDLITIEYRGHSALTPRDKLAYAYRLVGHEDDWQATRQVSVSYRDLPIGDYTFEVKAVDGDLNYSAPATMVLHITPAYTQLALLFGFTLSLGGAAVAIVYGVRRRRERDLARVELAKERRQRIELLPHHIDAWTVDDFVGASTAHRQMLEQIRQLQEDGGPVMITGEPGTGKELAARAIHAGSSRHSGPFVPLRCAGLPADVTTSLTRRTQALSQLFGHVQGAFPEAGQDQEGVIQQAHGGTLYLDEVGVLALPLQAHLLRVLSERKVQRTGGSEPEAFDLRIIAGSSEDLAVQVEVAAFHAPFYEHLTAHTLSIPALRDRPEDIPLLAQWMIDDLSRGLETKSVQLGEEILQLLGNTPLPGNARELRHLLERALREQGPGDLRPQDFNLQT